MSDAVGRVAVIGDVGGHLDELHRALVDLGMDPRLHRLPPDLTIVQVGDLVHRGPHSEQVVAFVDAILRNQPTQWVQLVGNHEQLYVAERSFSWGETISGRAAGTLRRWWATGLMVPAAAVETATGQQWLVTHAGLTVGFWRRVGCPTNATDAAGGVNAVDRDPVLGQLWRAGAMLGQPTTLQAGPLWASAPLELLPSWCGPDAPPVPFNQCYGHSSAVGWEKGQRFGGPVVTAVTEVDAVRRHVTTRSGENVLVGLDPGHAKTAAPSWAPFVLHDARVTSC